MKTTAKKRKRIPTQLNRKRLQNNNPKRKNREISTSIKLQKAHCPSIVFLRWVGTATKTPRDFTHPTGS
jgi:poly-gamma-glutamate capsule biosynthesis protein CapA/YwtB (metallophosphatase superfamily)